MGNLGWTNRARCCGCPICDVGSGSAREGVGVFQVHRSEMKPEGGEQSEVRAEAAICNAPRWFVSECVSVCWRCVVVFIGLARSVTG